ncbi:unnamed protein product [Diatraea saccharalis]|uniref:TIL domain-containing protein n=1 Tax=Diatraea saccharalis TaxID=40085 RepID=A0A9N9R1P9_9NEOP|nr:unnamed protein product [Diatraea saccharalis]
MTYWKYILCIYLLSFVSCEEKTTANVTCGPNEYLDDCPTKCPSDYCPKYDGEDRFACNKPKICPKPACKCRFNYRRACNGTCIPTRNCPPFPCNRPNEVFNPCPPLCPTDQCSQATPTGECPPQFGNILIVLPCNPRCRCKPHYWRNNGVCVPYDQCPNIIAAQTNSTECEEYEDAAIPL